MKRIKKILVLVFFSSLLFHGCRPTNKSTSAFLPPTVDLIREEAGGDILIKVFASGATQAECIENAQYNAVREVVFRGIKGARDQRALVLGANPEEKYREYFSKFFAKDGPYKSYVFLNNRGNIDKNDRFESASGRGRRNIGSKRAERMSIGVEVTVKKEELKRELEKNLF
jgi:hypothetical protein